MRVFTVALACFVLAAACGGKSAAPPPPPPAAPAGLAATGGNGQIALTWTAVPGATSYLILRGDAAGTEAALTPPAASTAAAYTDTGLTAGKIYYYVVQAKNNAGTSPKSAEASALTAPGAPAGLSVITTDTSALVQWTASPGATDYVVSRAAGGTTTFSQVAATTTPGASEGGLTPNTPYVYAVRAHNSSGTSADATSNATTAPIAPTALMASASNHHVTLNWTAAAGAGTGGYRVLRSTSASGPFTSVGTASGISFTDTFLTNNTPYFYVVHTIGGTGESGDSGPASATPFIEICTVDAASDQVSVFDGTANGNAAPKRFFGWTTGIAEGTGIGTDGTNVYVASKYTKTVNVYLRTTVANNKPPDRTISLPFQPTALTVDALQAEIYVAMGPVINVYSTAASGAAPTLKRSLTSSGTIRGIQVFRGVTGSTTVNQTFVVSDNRILVYNNGDSGTIAPQTTMTPQGVDAATQLVGPAYDPIDDVIFVGWSDRFTLKGYVAPYLRTSPSGVTSPFASRTPITDPLLLYPGGIVVDGTLLWVATYNGYPGNGALLKFPRASSGPASPTGGFNGPKAPIYKPGPLLLDTTNNEFWFLNGKNGALAFTKTGISTSPPAYSLMGRCDGPLRSGGNCGRPGQWGNRHSQQSILRPLHCGVSYRGQQPGGARPKLDRQPVGYVRGLSRNRSGERRILGELGRHPRLHSA